MSNKDSVLNLWMYTLGALIAIGVSTYYQCTEERLAQWLQFADLHLKPVLITLFQQNQFVQVVIFGSVTAYFCYVSNVFYRMMILPLFTGMQCSIVIHNTDPNFNAIMDYLCENVMKDSSAAQYSLQANTKVKENLTRKDWMKEWLGTDKTEPESFIYRPDNDQVIHVIIYQGEKIYLERCKSSAPMMGGSDKPFTPESLKLTVWGNDNTVLKQLMSDALAAAHNQLRDGALNIYTLSSGWWSSWELALTKKARSKESVILDMDDMDTLLSDARNFLSSGKWYVDMGIPYRRGYLLYGPPGCGKTSFAQVLAGELQLDLCILNLTHEGLTDDAVAGHLRDAPDRSIIVLEDVDAIFVDRGAAENAHAASSSSSSSGRRRGGGSTGVSFSGLLNALDGVASQEGRLLFMTTNHIEKLDPALIRPGRCDVQLEVKLASKLQMERMFLRFFPGEAYAGLAKEFAASLPANELSMATLQGYFLKCANSAADCVANTSDLLQASRPVEAQVKSVFELLRRVGLQRYAAVLEARGISSAEELFACKLEDVLKVSVEMQYDPVAKHYFALLLNDDNSTGSPRDVFIREVYSLAEVSHMREIFIAAYSADIGAPVAVAAAALADSISVLQLTRAGSNSSNSDRGGGGGGGGEGNEDNEEEDTELLLKKLCSPLLRQHSLTTEDGKSDIADNEMGADAETSNPAFLAAAEATKNAQPRQQATTGPLTVEKLNSLSKSFCAILSKGGKGTVSLYNVRRLIDAHPHRPEQCVANAHAFTAARSLEEKIPHRLNLYEFLKRMGLGAYIHSFLANDISTVRDLLACKEESAVQLKNTYKLTIEAAFRLHEILQNKDSESGNLIHFALPSRSRVISVFELFYSAGGAAAFPVFTEGMKVDDDNDDNDDDDDDDDEKKGKNATAPAETKSSAKQEVNQEEKIATNNLQQMSPVSLEQLAYEFGVLVSDRQGVCRVSLLEAMDYLRSAPYAADPQAAVQHALAELVHPPFPAAPAPAPRPPPEREWIDEWFAACREEEVRLAKEEEAVARAKAKSAAEATTTSTTTSTAAAGEDAGGEAVVAGNQVKEAEKEAEKGKEAAAEVQQQVVSYLPSDLTPLVDKLKDHGFSTLHDFLAGGQLLTVQELQEMGVNKLSERRRIVDMHRTLLKLHNKLKE